MKIKLNKHFWWICAIICLIHFAFWLYICFPGVLYGDNMMMLAEAIPEAGIGDQHSVMFIWLWRCLNKIFGYGLGYPLIWGMFLWYTGVFMYTVGLFNLLKNYLVLLFIAIFSYVPYINFIVPHIQLKDINMSAVLFAASGMLFWVWTIKPGNKKKFFLICAILLFFLAINFRHNAIFAFIPLAFLLAIITVSKTYYWQQFANSKKPLYKFFILSGVLIVGLFIGKSKFENKVEDYKNYFVHSSIFEFDLAGISVNTDKMVIPKERLMEGITLDSLKKVFNTAGWDPLWGGWGSSPRIVKGGETEEDLTLWFKTWFFTVLDNPGTYLKHRSDHFDRFVVSKNEYVCICEWPPETGQGVLKSLLPSNLQGYADEFPKEGFRIRGVEYLRKREMKNKLLEKEVYNGKNGEYKYGEWLFMTYPKYTITLLNHALVLSLIFSFFLWIKPKYFSIHQRRIIPFATGIYFSGWIYFMAYFFVSISSDWRYIHWSSLSFWIGSCLMLTALIGTKPYYFLLLKCKRIALESFQILKNSKIIKN